MDVHMSTGDRAFYSAVIAGLVAGLVMLAYDIYVELPSLSATSPGPHPTEPCAACSICLETGHGTWVRTQCGHTFHRACLAQWQATTCPLCRGRFDR